MKLLIFGATGSVGRELLIQALEQGHAVTAFTRNPARAQIRHDNLRVFEGDAMDLRDVERAMQGQEAVFCSLGGRHSTIRSQGTRNIIRAMEETGVRRFVCQSTLGVGDSWNNLGFFWKHIMFRGILRPVYTDHVQQEEYVRQSGLDWTIVRPGAFTDGERTGQYRHGFAGDDRTTTLRISRADVADFMLRQLTDDTYLHGTPGLSY